MRQDSFVRRLAIVPAQVGAPCCEDTKAGVARRGSMGIVEILLLAALVVYLFGEDIGKRSHP